MKACPAGWRLPDTVDWDGLVRIAGGDKVAGGSLKAKIGWNESKGRDEERSGTDDYGFSALPGGKANRRHTDSHLFLDTGVYGNWWSATEHCSSYAYFRAMGFRDKWVTENHYDKVDGFSVRCVQDMPELCDGVAAIKSNYDNAKLLLAMSLILKDELGDFFIGKDSSFYNEPWISHLERIQIADREPRVLDSLLCVVMKMNNRGAILKRIRHWFEAYNVIDAMGEKLEEKSNYCCEDYLELLISIPMIRQVWATVVDTTMQQYAGSLASSQRMTLSSKIYMHLSGLQDRERAAFYKTLEESVNKAIREGLPL
jgi:uncharacterized protein (TIGR02145 family)